MLKELIPDSWKKYLQSEFEKEYFLKLNQKIEEEYNNYNIFPEKENIFKFLEYTNPQNIKVVIIGQDPYIKKGQAHGLSFSVQEGIALPKSLQNIFKELENDIGVKYQSNGSLIAWAKQGVLLLNSILTVREGASNSHSNVGWQIFTQKIIEIILCQNNPTVFIVWGAFANSVYETAIQSLPANEKKILKIFSPHPSPLSAYRGFFGSKPFSKTNIFLSKNNQVPIDWNL